MSEERPAGPSESRRNAAGSGLAVPAVISAAVVIVATVLLQAVGFAVAAAFVLFYWVGRSSDDDAPPPAGLGQPAEVQVAEPPPEAYYRRVAEDVACLGLEDHLDAAYAFFTQSHQRLELQPTTVSGHGAARVKVIGCSTDEDGFRRTDPIGYVPAEVAARLAAEEAGAPLQATLQVMHVPHHPRQTGGLRFDIWVMDD